MNVGFPYTPKPTPNPSHARRMNPSIEKKPPVNRRLFCYRLGMVETMISLISIIRKRGLA
jgi:hypothetical protein